MFNDKEIHKKTIKIILCVIAFLVTIFTLVYNFPKVMGVISLILMAVMVIGAIYLCVYMAVKECKKG